jgi:hypothetical protein
MTRTTLFLLAVWFGLASVPLRAMCPKRTLEEQFAGSAIVFVGRATSQTVESGPNGVSTATTFIVEDMWKGTPATEVRVRTCGGVLGDTAYTCGESFRFRIGLTYLVFASGERFETSTCVPTALLERASATLEWLAKQPRLTGR